MQDLEHKLSYAQQESKLLNRHLHESEEARRIQQRQVRSIAQMVFFWGHPDDAPKRSGHWFWRVKRTRDMLLMKLGT